MSAGDEALKRVMRLEVALLILVNSLRGKDIVPEPVLDSFEKIVSPGGAQLGNSLLRKG